MGQVQRIVRESLSAGADLVALPENYAGIGPVGTRPSWGFDTDAPHDSEVVAPLLELSVKSESVLVLGGVPERMNDGDARTFNTCLILHRGRVVARYRKMHRFDATLSAGKLSESAYTRPGMSPLLLETAFARLGVTICYDLRFPETYRLLSECGAEAFLVPSAFTYETGRAHWEVLLRARAIEGLAYVIAPAQWGEHAPGRQSFGHTMIVSPWGEIVASQASGDGAVSADVDPLALKNARGALPALQHRVVASETQVEVVSLTNRDGGT
jgi:nitrilase